MSEVARDFVDETMESMELATRLNAFRLNRDAWVCRNDTLRRKGQLRVGKGISYAGIVRTCAADNAELDDRNRITLDSIRTPIAGRIFQSKASSKRPTGTSSKASCAGYHDDEQSHE